MNVVFFGTPRLAQIVLETLIDSPFRPQVVVTSPNSRVGRGLKAQPSPVKQTAVKNHLPVLAPINLSDVKGQLSDVDLVILVAYGKIIPSEILKIPRYGFINVHPSLLPKYRGASPIQSAILEGAEKTGVTIIKLDEEIDHGPILAQREVLINKDDTQASLIEKLGKLGAKLLIESLPKYLEEELKPKPQGHSKATYTKRITKTDGKIDPKKPPDPTTFERMVRAYYPWPGVWTRLRTTDYRLRTIKFLPGNLIQPEGKRAMSIEAFKNGYPRVYEQIKHVFSQNTQS